MKHKGFPVPGGYMGLMPSGKYQIFDTEGEYEDYMKEVSSNSISEVEENENKRKHRKRNTNGDEPVRTDV